MQEMIPSFSTIMAWVVLLLCLVAVVLLGMSAWHLPQDRRRALFGVVAMALVVAATAISQVLLSQKGHSIARLLLPLAAPLLMFSLSRLSFPPVVPVQTSRLNKRHYLLLLLLTLGAFMTTAGLVLLDLLFL
jgi:amino acid transporter